jgi:hypothetical protein
MLRSFNAEWLLARFVGHQQSAALMGDLLEQRTERGAWWFWRSFSGLLLAAAWRPLVGFIAAVVVSAVASSRLMTSTIGMWSTAPLQTTMFVAMASWFVAVYSGVRYGARDALSQVAGAGAMLSTMGILLWRHPAALLSVGAVAIGVALVFILLRSHRMAMGALVTTSVIFLAGYALMAYSSDVYVHHVLRIRLLGSAELKQHPSIQYVILAFLLLGEGVTAFVCAKLHHKFVKRPNPDLIMAR